MKTFESLFKSLRSSGISFRKGLTFDLNLSSILSGTGVEIDESILRCLGQLSRLQKAMTSPEKHLTSAFMERAQGFANELVLMLLDLNCHLMLNSRNLKKFQDVKLLAQNFDLYQIEAEDKIQKFLRKCLNSIMEICKFRTTQEPTKLSENLQGISENFKNSLKIGKMNQRYPEFAHLAPFMDQNSVEEADQILANFELAQNLNISKNLQILRGISHHFYLIIESLANFSMKKYKLQKDNDEEQDDDQGQGQGDAKAGDGCGLGEGQGDKSTLEDVESEDLFENEQPKDDESRDKNGDGDEFVDFSDNLDVDHENVGDDEDGDHDDDDQENGGDDYEEGQADDENDPNENKDDEVLNGDDWGDDDKDKAKGDEAADALDDPDHDPDLGNDDDQNEDKMGRDFIQKQEEDPDKRDRKPDNEDNEEVDPDMKDDLYDDLKDEDVQDLDLDQDDLQGMDEDDNDDAEVDDEVENDVERLADFKDEEPNEGQGQEEMIDNAQVEGQGEQAEDNQQDQRNKSEKAKGNVNKAQKEDTNDDDGQDENDQEGQNDDDNKSRGQGQGQNDEDRDEDQDVEMKEAEEEDQIEDQDDECDLDLEMAAERKDIIKAKRDEIKDKLESEVHVKDQDESEDLALDDVNFEKIKSLKSKKIDLKKGEDEKNEEIGDEKKSLDQKMDVEGQHLVTSSVERGFESVINVADLNINDDDLQDQGQMMAMDVDEVQGSDDSNVHEWLRLCQETCELSQHLTEQLRLIIEPTKATRLRGDFKTGKRLNMKRIIPYIASNFRKDKIWLRRTKPSKRDVQVCIAIDDSSSMSDNSVQEVTFQALATLCQSLSVLEVGSLGLVRFGEDSEVILKMKRSFSASDGANALGKLGFTQKVTKLLPMLNLAGQFMSEAGESKLLIVLSDGKGVLNEGKKKVTDAVRTARLKGITVVFIIMEAVNSGGESVLDIRMPIFDDKNNLLAIEPYMEHFPFPFYIILRDIQNLPQVLGDALRQWFEMIHNAK